MYYVKLPHANKLPHTTHTTAYYGIILCKRKIILFWAPNGTRTKADWLLLRERNAGLSKMSRDFFECRPMPYSCLAVSRSVSLVSNLPNKFCKEIFFEVMTLFVSTRSLWETVIIWLFLCKHIHFKISFQIIIKPKCTTAYYSILQHTMAYYGVLRARGTTL